MARRKIENSHTTISILWKDKEDFRKHAKVVKKTRTGSMHESDAVLFQRVLQFYNQHHHTTESAKSTYPSQDTNQQG